jgi:hypothetical protein
MAGAEFFQKPPRESKTHQLAKTDLQCGTTGASDLSFHEIAEKTNPQNT